MTLHVSVSKAFPGYFSTFVERNWGPGFLFVPGVQAFHCSNTSIFELIACTVTSMAFQLLYVQNDAYLSSRTVPQAQNRNTQFFGLEVVCVCVCVCVCLCVCVCVALG